MARFILTIILTDILLLSGLVIIVTKTDPYTNIVNRILFLMVFLAFITLLNSLINYVLRFIKAPRNTPLKRLYRKGFKGSFALALIITLIATLKAFEALTILNLVLLSVLIIIVSKVKQRY
ncbi:MAG: hypothetical protein AAB443_01760 [Patescibacteria group bacterium]